MHTLTISLAVCLIDLFLFCLSPSGRANELRQMSGGGGGANDALWTNFYDTLSQIRMYHAKYPNAARLSAKDKEKALEKGAAGEDAGADGGAEGEVEALVAPARGLNFSVEESFGTRVDMHLLHDRYINLPQFSRHTDYLTFLATFSALHTVPRERKLKAQPADYRRFVADLLEYLTDFHKRIRPLADVQVLRDMVREEFDKRWEAKDLPGWFDGATAAAAAAEHEPGAPAPAAAAAAAGSGSDGAAAAPGADGAATADASNPLYCVACAKLFAKDSVFAAHLTGKKHKKNEEIRAALNQPAAAAAAAVPAADANASAEGAPNSGVASAAAPSVSKVAAELRSLALLEYEVAQFAALLSSQIEATRTHLLKKQTRTFEEIAAEMEAAAAEAVRAKLSLKNGGADPAAKDADDEEEEDAANAPLYNPLNLPLGFDGKPIPYWLYKLHGLNLKFDCEICGNYSYAGPRNFERHFTEWRHAYGMRALGIPNTKHFAHITKMADAQALFEKLKREGAGAGFRADDEEEYEDADGNVFNKRTFLELQKQGLV